MPADTRIVFSTETEKLVAAVGTGIDSLAIEIVIFPAENWFGAFPPRHPVNPGRQNAFPLGVAFDHSVFNHVFLRSKDGRRRPS